MKHQLQRNVHASEKRGTAMATTGWGLVSLAVGRAYRSSKEGFGRFGRESSGVAAPPPDRTVCFARLPFRCSAWKQTAQYSSSLHGPTTRGTPVVSARISLWEGRGRNGRSGHAPVLAAQRRRRLALDAEPRLNRRCKTARRSVKIREARRFSDGGCSGRQGGEGAYGGTTQQQRRRQGEL